MRTIFIWDIHGCYDEFMLLIAKLNIKKDDKVYLVWDMINKWPKSYKTLKFIYKNREQYKAILWNHEIGFLNWLDWNAPKYECRAYRKLRAKLHKKPALLQYIKDLPAYIETDDFLMIHGWIIPWKLPSEHEINEITRLREYEWKPWHSYYEWKKPIIYGHWAMQGLNITNNTIWLDSSCVYGKQLTAYILETKEIIQQKAIKLHSLIWNTKLEKTLYKIKWNLGLIK